MSLKWLYDKQSIKFELFLILLLLFRRFFSGMVNLIEQGVESNDSLVWEINPLTNPTDNFLIIKKFEFFYLKKQNN